MSQKYRCISGFAYLPESGMKIYGSGLVVDADDPILKTHRAFFTPVPQPETAAPAPPPTERATAIPDERRELSTPKRKPGRPRKNPLPPVVEPEPVIEPEPVTEEN